MTRIPFESNSLMIAAIIVLVGAPTAGATMMLGAREAAAAPSFEQETGAPGAGARGLKVELVAPKEPEVAATYPMEAFATPPVDEFKGRAPHGRAWRVSFGLDFPPSETMAEPAGAYGSMPADEAALEQARFERVRDDYLRAERARAALRFAQAEQAQRPAYEDYASAAATEQNGPTDPQARDDGF